MGRIHFNLADNTIILDVTLLSVTSRDFRNVKLVLDTGATITCLSPDAILGLGYDLSNPKEELSVFTASGTIQATVITLSELSAIRETLENIDVVIYELPQQLMDHGIQGLLGLDFLKHFDVNICFSAGFIDIQRISQ